MTDPSETAQSTTALEDVIFVPCRITDLGIDVLVTGHLPDGTPTAIAFTSPEAVSRAMGASQAWIRLSPHGLRSMLGPRGITTLRIDPDLVAPNPVTTPGERCSVPSPLTGSRSTPVLSIDHA